MTNMVKLIEQWEHAAAGKLTTRELCMKLPLDDAARIAALVEMYPRRSETELISELLGAALDELENAMPYIPGPRIVAEDEEGNPVLEDIGPTPRFLELSRKYRTTLARRQRKCGKPETWALLRERLRRATAQPHLTRERQSS